MRFKCITCEALARPVYLCAAHSPHIVDIELFKKGLHLNPADLRVRLQESINELAEQSYDAILLAYGLCGKATAGLVSVKVPLIIPRAHDCITLFLGGRKRYQDQFENYPGTYWYAQDYIEREDGSGATLALGSGSDLEIQATYNEFVSKYGKDNADYLMEAMGAWQKHYKRAVFIDMGIADGGLVESRAQAEAARRGWTFERLAGDLVLIRRLLMGEWEEDFLVLQPGQKIEMAHDERILECSRNV
jgi:hypothetical protein